MTFVPNVYACSVHTVYMAQVLCSTYTGGAKVCKLAGAAANKGTDILS